jgi:hypothetical protein
MHFGIRYSSFDPANGGTIFAYRYFIAASLLRGTFPACWAALNAVLKFKSNPGKACFQRRYLSCLTLIRFCGCSPDSFTGRSNPHSRLALDAFGYFGN